MKAALSTLTPAITRARRSAPAQACTAAKVGTMNRPPAIARPGEIDRHMDAAPGPEDVGDALARRGRRRPQVAQPRSIAEQAEQDGADQRRQQDDAPGREPGREPRADRDRDREDREADRDHLLGAAEHVLHQRRQQRERDRAHEPEPARHDRAPPDAPVVAQVLDADRQWRRRCCGGSPGRAPPSPVRRDEQARDPAHQREHDHQRAQTTPGRRRPWPRARRRWCRAGWR